MLVILPGLFPEAGAAQAIGFGPPIEVSDVELLPRPGPGVTQVQVVGSELLVTGDTDAIRLQPDGSAVDDLPYRIPQNDMVACSDTTCLSVRLSTGGSARTQRFQPDGTLVDPGGVPFASVYSIVIAWDGTAFLVVWSDRTTRQMQWVHVRPDGTSVEATPVARDLPASGFEQPVGLACGTTECLLVYTAEGEVRAMRITATTTLDSMGIDLLPAVAIGSVSSDVTFQGDWYLVWYNGDAVRVRRDGTVLDTTPIRLGNAYNGDAACTSTGCLVLLNRGVRLLQLDGTLTTESSAIDYVAGRTLTPGRIACTAAECLALYQDRTTEILIARRLMPDGTLIVPDEINPVQTAVEQDTPQLAANDTGFLAAWQEQRTPVATRATRIVGGVALDHAAPIEVSSNGGPRSASFGAGVFMVLVGGDSVRRVGSDGSTPDAAPIRLSTISTDPRADALDFDGRNFFIVGRTATGTSRLAGRRVSPIGATLEPNWLTIETGFRNDARVSFDGTNHLVAWSEFRTSRGAEIYGRRMAPDGTPLDALSMPIASADDDQTTPSIAFGIDQYLVAWLTRGSAIGSTSRSLHAARVDLDGVVLDPLGVTLRDGANLSEGNPLVGWDGSSFYVAWSETERVEDPPGSGAFRFDLFGAAARIDASGRLLDDPPARFPLNNGFLSALAAGPAGVVVAYREDVPGLLDQARVFVREVRTGFSSGEACSDASECASRTCVDSICCDRACEGRCEACTIAAGASADGTCEPLGAGTVCRAASGAACDVDEICDGSSAECPPDEPMMGCTPSDDAGTTMPGDDGGATDAGGTVGDGGSVTAMDAGATVDAGPTGGTSDCSCRVHDGYAPSPAWLGLLAAVLVSRRRRRHGSAA